eukprot:PhM_4_TR18805/c2_g1_i1/m.91503
MNAVVQLFQGEEGAAHRTRQVTRTPTHGRVTVVADECKGCGVVSVDAGTSQVLGIHTVVIEVDHTSFGANWLDTMIPRTFSCSTQVEAGRLTASSLQQDSLELHPYAPLIRRRRHPFPCRGATRGATPLFDFDVRSLARVRLLAFECAQSASTAPRFLLSMTRNVVPLI